MHGSDPTSSKAANTDGRRFWSGGSRRGLPTGRALIGGLLVTMAAVVVFSAYAGAQSAPSATVVTARRDIRPGERLRPDDLEQRAAEIGDDLAGRTFSDADALLGAVTLAPLGAGELVQRSSVRTSGADELGPELTFPVDRDRALNGEIRPGETIDLLATFDSNSDAFTTVLARTARVLAVEDSRSGSLGSSGGLVLTVGLESSDQVLDVAHASQVAVITVVRATGFGDAGTPATRDRTTGPSADPAAVTTPAGPADPGGVPTGSAEAPEPSTPATTGGQP